MRILRMYWIPMEKSNDSIKVNPVKVNLDSLRIAKRFTETFALLLSLDRFRFTFESVLYGNRFRFCIDAILMICFPIVEDYLILCYLIQRSIEVETHDLQGWICLPNSDVVRERSRRSTSKPNS